jgi:hypothetical protein
MGYYLADDINPPWSTLVKNIPMRKDKKEAIYAKAQEACLKDIERSFSVCKLVCNCLRPCSFMEDEVPPKYHEGMCDSSQHIIEDERHKNLVFSFDNVGSRPRPVRDPDRIQAFLQTYQEIQNSGTHAQLNVDLSTGGR